MPRYKVELHRTAKRQLDRLPRVIQWRVAEAISELADEPRPGGCSKLAGRPNDWRIRIGDYRVIYQIRDQVLHVLVVRVGHRRDIYH